MTDRLTKFNAEKGEYEYKERAKTQAEFNEQRKAVIQRLGELEDRAEGHWKKRLLYSCNWDDFYNLECSICGIRIGETALKEKDYKYCLNCGAKMKGVDDEQR